MNKPKASATPRFSTKDVNLQRGFATDPITGKQFLISIDPDNGNLSVSLSYNPNNMIVTRCDKTEVEYINSVVLSKIEEDNGIINFRKETVILYNEKTLKPYLEINIDGERKEFREGDILDIRKGYFCDKLGEYFIYNNASDGTNYTIFPNEDGTFELKYFEDNNENKLFPTIGLRIGEYYMFFTSQDLDFIKAYKIGSNGKISEAEILTNDGGIFVGIKRLYNRRENIFSETLLATISYNGTEMTKRIQNPFGEDTQKIQVINDNQIDSDSELITQDKCDESYDKCKSYDNCDIFNKGTGDKIQYYVKNKGETEIKPLIINENEGYTSEVKTLVREFKPKKTDKLCGKIIERVIINGKHYFIDTKNFIGGKNDDEIEIINGLDQFLEQKLKLAKYGNQLPGILDFETIGGENNETIIFLEHPKSIFCVILNDNGDFEVSESKIIFDSNDSQKELKNLRHEDYDYKIIPTEMKGFIYLVNSKKPYKDRFEDIFEELNPNFEEVTFDPYNILLSRYTILDGNLHIHGPLITNKGSTVKELGEELISNLYRVDILKDEQEKQILIRFNEKTGQFIELPGLIKVCGKFYLLDSDGSLFVPETLQEPKVEETKGEVQEVLVLGG